MFPPKGTFVIMRTLEKQYDLEDDRLCLTEPYAV